jgi:hypothetical protein
VKPGRGAGLLASVLVAGVFSIPAVRLAAGDPRVISDDARLHVFWMQRFDDPALFPHDLIADYFQQLAPPGFTALYYLLSTVGVSPLVACRWIPVVIVLVCSPLSFLLLRRLALAPVAALAGSAIVSQLLWMRDDVPSASPRAFAYPLLLALLWLLVERRESRRRALDALLIAVVVAHALFYPPAALVAVGAVILESLTRGLGVERDRWRPRAAVAAIATAAALAILALPSVLPGSFGPAYDAATTRAMPEFGRGGRVEYWVDDPVQFWLLSPTSGLVSVVRPWIVLAGALLPLLVVRPSRFPLLRSLRSVNVLALPAISGAGLFLAAHVLFPRLYWPSRYVHFSLQLVLALAAAIVIAAVVDRLLAGLRPPAARAAVLAVAAVPVLSTPVLVTDYPAGAFHHASAPELQRFLRQQPVDTVVASVSTIADDIPTFAARSVLVSPHYAFAFHRGFYDPLRERTLDLIAGQYTDDRSRLGAVIERWGIDYWLLDDGFDRPSYVAAPWLRQFPPAWSDARSFLERGGRPVVASMPQCIAIEGRGYRLLEAKCLAAAAVPPSES